MIWCQFLIVVGSRPAWCEARKTSKTKSSAKIDMIEGIHTLESKTWRRLEKLTQDMKIFSFHSYMVWGTTPFVQFCGCLVWCAPRLSGSVLMMSCMSQASGRMPLSCHKIWDSRTICPQTHLRKAGFILAFFQILIILTRTASSTRRAPESISMRRCWKYQSKGLWFI